MHSEQRQCGKGRRANGTFSHRADIRERLSPALAQGTLLAYGSAWLLEEPHVCVNFCLQVMKHPKRLFNNYLPVSEQLRGGASSNCFGEYLHFCLLIFESFRLWRPSWHFFLLVQIRNFGDFCVRARMEG